MDVVVVHRGGPVKVSMPSDGDDGDDVEQRNDAVDGRCSVTVLLCIRNGKFVLFLNLNFDC